MLFTLTALKILRMASGAAKNKVEQQNFFHARMTFIQSLMVAVSALKLDYTSVIFIDIQIVET